MIGLIILAIVMLISLIRLWVGGIDYMAQNHPDYKGEDFLNLDITEQDKKDIQ
jgi:hypothetical protein